MCNNEEDFCGIAKYKSKTNLFDKIVIGFIFTILSFCLIFMTIGLVNPSYFTCN